MATVLLVRHGETAWNREGRVQGWAPTSLTDRGREQAAAVGGHLAERGVDRVVASDLRRAAETARAVVRATGAPLALDRGWRERDVGVYQGLSPAELYGRHPEFSVFETGYAAAEATPERGESIVDARTRVLDAFDRLCSSLGGAETVAVVAHGGPVRMVAAHLRELDVVAALEDLEVDNCSVTEVPVEGGPSLASVGDVVPGVAAVDG